MTEILLVYLRDSSPSGEQWWAAMTSGAERSAAVASQLDLSGLSASGFIERPLDSSNAQSLARALDSELPPSPGGYHCGALAPLTPERRKNTEYLAKYRDVLFTLFNEGALRATDAAARQALLDSFSFLPNRFLDAGGAFVESSGAAVDKFQSLMAVRADRLRSDENRIIPGAMIRDGARIGKRNIFMFHAAVNIAAYIGDDNLVDSHASVGSAAQVGSKNKIGSFVSLEGVLSPANAEPVILGDDNFIGSFARIGTGLIIGDRNFIGAGVNISRGTKLRDCRPGSPSHGAYVQTGELNGSFDGLALAPNNAAREFNGTQVLPGEILLFDNTDDFMRRFEGDARIRADKK